MPFLIERSGYCTLRTMYIKRYYCVIPSKSKLVELFSTN